jgi:hypothetical protein
MSTHTARTEAPATTHDTTQETRTMPLTMDAAGLRRIALTVEKSAARDDSCPVLSGINASVSGDRLTLAAAAVRNWRRIAPKALGAWVMVVSECLIRSHTNAGV